MFPDDLAVAAPPAPDLTEDAPVPESVAPVNPLQPQAPDLAASKPTAPPHDWPTLEASDAYTALPSEDKARVIHAFADHVRDYALSQSGADPAAINGQVDAFREHQVNSVTLAANPEGSPEYQAAMARETLGTGHTVADATRIADVEAKSRTVSGAYAEGGIGGVLVENPPLLSSKVVQTGLEVANPVLGIANALLPGTAGKITRGATEGAADLVSGLTTPANLALLGTAGVGKVAQRFVALGFSADMLSQVPEQWHAFTAATDPQEKAKQAVGLVGTVLMGAAAGAHGVRGEPLKIPSHVADASTEALRTTVADPGAARSDPYLHSAAVEELARRQRVATVPDQALQIAAADKVLGADPAVKAELARRNLEPLDATHVAAASTASDSSLETAARDPENAASGAAQAELTQRAASRVAGASNHALQIAGGDQEWQAAHPEQHAAVLDELHKRDLAPVDAVDVARSKARIEAAQAIGDKAREAGLDSAAGVADEQVAEERAAIKAKAASKDLLVTPEKPVSEQNNARSQEQAAPAAPPAPPAPPAPSVEQKNVSEAAPILPNRGTPGATSVKTGAPAAEAGQPASVSPVDSPESRARAARALGANTYGNVRFKIAGPDGPMNVSGRVTRVLPDGRAELKTPNNGYHTIDVPKELPESAGARKVRPGQQEKIDAARQAFKDTINREDYAKPSDRADAVAAARERVNKAVAGIEPGAEHSLFNADGSSKAKPIASVSGVAEQSTGATGQAPLSAKAAGLVKKNADLIKSNPVTPDDYVKRSVAIRSILGAKVEESKTPAVWIDHQLVIPKGKYEPDPSVASGFKLVQSLSQSGFERNLDYLHTEGELAKGEGEHWGANQAAKDLIMQRVSERQAKQDAAVKAETEKRAAESVVSDREHAFATEVDAKVAGIKFKRGEVKRSGIDKEGKVIERPAEKAQIANGLAITKDPSKYESKPYTVTHPESGKRVGAFATIRDAKAFVARVGELIDFSKPEAQILKAAKEHRVELDAIQKDPYSVPEGYHPTELLTAETPKEVTTDGSKVREIPSAPTQEKGQVNEKQNADERRNERQNAEVLTPQREAGSTPARIGDGKWSHVITDAQKEHLVNLGGETPFVPNSKEDFNQAYLRREQEVAPPSGRISKSGGFIDSDGQEIKIGDQIKLNFAGGPHDMPAPWTLVKAEDKFTTVSYTHEPSITVRAADGTERTYDNANQYSPRKTPAVDTGVAFAPLRTERNAPSIASAGQRTAPVTAKREPVSAGSERQIAPPPIRSADKAWEEDSLYKGIAKITKGAPSWTPEAAAHIAHQIREATASFGQNDDAISAARAKVMKALEDNYTRTGDPLKTPSGKGFSASTVAEHAAIDAAVRPLAAAKRGGTLDPETGKMVPPTTVSLNQERPEGGSFEDTVAAPKQTNERIEGAVATLGTTFDKAIADFAPDPHAAQATRIALDKITEELTGTAYGFSEGKPSAAAKRLAADPEFERQVRSQVVAKVFDAIRKDSSIEDSIFGFGPGAAAKGEIPEAKSVSIANARVDEERVARGELPLMSPARKAMGTTWDEAMQRVERDPTAGTQLVNDVLNGTKRDISETDHAVLLHERIRVMNERSMAADRITDPHTSEEDRVASRVSWAANEDRINQIDQATHEAGTISGRALQFRRALARDDYTFAGMERNARAVKGEALTPEESTQIKARADRIAKADAEATDKEKKVGQDRADAAVGPAIKQMRGDKTPVDREAVLEKLKANSSDPSSYLQRIALSFVRDGITEREPLIAAVHDFTHDVTGFDLRETRDAVSGYGQFKPLDKETAKVQLRQIKGESQQISKLEDMAAGQAPLKTGIERRTASDEERGLIKQVNEAKKAGGFNVTDPATQLRSALESVKTRLRNQITDLQTQIDTGEKTVKTRTAPPTDAEANALRAKRDEVRKQYDEIFGTGLTDTQRLANAKRYLTRRAADFEDRIARNDFAPRERPEPVKMDPEATALRAKAENLKLDWDREVKRRELAARPFWQKAIDQVAGSARFAALSGYHTLEKLFGYTVARGLEVPLTEAAGAVIDRIPGLKQITTQSTLESGPHARAIASYYKAFFTTGVREAAQTMRSYGQGDVKSVLGKKYVAPPQWYDFWGVVHQAEKSPTLIAATALHYEKATAHAISSGVDVSDPLVQGALHKEAYDYAQRSILQEKNQAASWVNDFNRRMTAVNPETGEASAIKTALAKGIETLFTKGIIKTPANYVMQTLERTPLGLATAVGKTAKAWIKGVDTLKPAETNTIARLWKVGAVGTGFFVWGMLDALKDEKDRVFGGYYQPGEKRSATDTKWGSVRLGGFTSHILTHFPLLESAQIGNTFMRVARSRLRKSDAQDRGALAGIVSALMGLADRAPIASQALRLGDIKNPQRQDSYIGNVVAGLIPQMVANLAEDLDRGVQRQPKGIVQSIEMRVPWLRPRVPEKTGKKSEISGAGL